MGFEDMTLREYFRLRSRESFSINPWDDSAIYFGDRSLAERIHRRLESDFVHPRGVPKFYISGRWGAGKTHTLAHIRHKLITEFAKMYPTEPIYVDIAPLTAKERYRRIHERLLDAIGLDRTRQAAESLADSTGNPDKVLGFLESKSLPYGETALQVSQANVIRNLLFGGRQMQLSWEWMKGRKTTVDEAQMIGTQKQLGEPQDLVNCLLNLGVLFAKGMKKRIVFLIDEGEATRYVTHPDSIAELRHAFRLLLDNDNNWVGLIIAIQAEGGQVADLGEIFSSEDLYRRIDSEQGQVDLNGLVQSVEDIEQFVLQSLDYLIDQGAAAQLISSEGLATSPALFPFEEDGKDALLEHIHQDPTRATASAIIATMGNAVIEAWRRRNNSQKRQLVDRAIIELLAYP
jgi:hypothetical protein